MALLPPQKCWLHWSTGVEGAEAGNSLRTVVCMTETALWRTVEKGRLLEGICAKDQDREISEASGLETVFR